MTPSRSIDESAAVTKSSLSTIPRNIIRQIHWRKIVPTALIAWLIAEGTLVFAIHFYGQSNHAQRSDVIILLGPPLERRVTHTLNLWRQGFAPRILCTGGVYEDAPSLTQAQDCYDQLVALGVPADAIVLENLSLSTEENAVYAQQIMISQNWHTAILVSDSSHLLRAQWLFSRYGIETVTSPVMFSDGYLQALFREVIAFHWQVIKDIFRLPVTHVSGV
jgi:uncharacterized SAM-binding protein YcdF (DUF218 family)